MDSLVLTIDTALGGHMMDIETAQRTLKKALCEAESTAAFTFRVLGRVSLAADYFRKVAIFEESYNVNGARLHNTVETDGRFLSAAWAVFFAEHGFNVALRTGRGTYGRMWSTPQRALRHLRRAGCSTWLLADVDDAVAANPDKAYAYCKKNGFSHVRMAAPPYGKGLNNAGYAHFLCRVFDRWYNDFSKGEYHSMQLFNSCIQTMLSIAAGGRPAGSCCSCPPHVDTDGSVYPCRYYRTRRYRLGNVRENDGFADLLTGNTYCMFAAPSATLHVDCQVCSWLPVCGGACWRERDPVKNGQPPKSRHCAAYKTFFSHAAPRMAAIAVKLENFRA